MNTSYYMRFRGEVTGPVSEERLSELIAAGSVTALHEVSQDRVRWISVRSWLGSRTAPPPIPSLPDPRNDAASNFRIDSQPMPSRFMGGESGAAPFDFLGTFAVFFACAACLLNIIWILRVFVLHVDSGFVVSTLIYGMPALLALLSLAAGLIRLFVGGRRLLAFVSLILGSFSLIVTLTGLLITNVFTNDAPTISSQLISTLTSRQNQS